MPKFRRIQQPDGTYKIESVPYSPEEIKERRSHSTILTPEEKLKVRFWRNVDKKGEDVCWNWTGYVNPSKNPSFGIDYSNYNPAKISYLLTNNLPIKKDLLVRHTCDNRRCCNPKHIILNDRASSETNEIQEKYIKSLKDSIYDEESIIRFISKVDIQNDEFVCWNWKGKLTNEGYANFAFDGLQISVGRISYNVHNNVISTYDKIMTHTCKNKLCCNPSHVKMIDPDPINNFWNNVNIKKEDDCWEYNEYSIRVDGKKDKPWRVSYILTFGSVPKDKCVGRTCHNTKCVNPKHLKLVDYSHELFEERYNSEGERKKRNLDVDYKIANDIRLRFIELQEKEKLLPYIAFNKLEQEFKTKKHVICGIIKNITWTAEDWEQYYKIKYNYDTPSIVIDYEIGSTIRKHFEELKKEGKTDDEAYKELYVKFNPTHKNMPSGYISKIIRNIIYKK